MRYTRFQYHHYRWRAFHTSLFHVYFPEGYDSACAYISAAVPGATALIRKRMATSLQSEPNIVLYPAADQLYESNIGSAEPKDVTLPTFIAKGTRLLVSYNGNYEDLNNQLLEAMVHATWETQINEGLEAQATGQASRESIPYWMKQGMIRYFAHTWPVQAEDALLQTVGTDTTNSWDAVIARRSALAGQALCYYLATRYYPEAPMQLYFLFRKRKPLPRALRLITKTTADSVYADCLRFYQQRASATKRTDTASGKILALPHKKGTVLSVLADEQQEAIAYIVATWHKRTVYIYDARTRQTALVTSYLLPPWINDHSSDPYPLMTWTPGKDLLVALPVKGSITLRRYDRSGNLRDHYPLEGLDGLSALGSTDDNNEFLLAAWRRAQSDIVQYQLQRDKYTPLTYDRYDETQPALNKGNEEVLFVTERPLTQEKDDTISRQGIFTYRAKEVHPFITDSTAYIRWTNPQFLPGGKVLAVTTEHGTEQWMLINNLVQPDRGNRTSLSAYGPVQHTAATNEMLSWQASRDSLYIRSQPLQSWIDAQKTAAITEPMPWLTDYRNVAAAKAKEDSILKAAIDPTPSFLEGMFAQGSNKEKRNQQQDSIRESLRYRPKKGVPYVLQLYSAYFTAKVNNDYFFNRYQPWLSYQGMFKAPATGGMAQGGFSDLFENHHFTIAYRLPAGSEGSDFFVRYRNTTNKVDWGLAYYRKAEDLKPDPLRRWVDEDGRPYPNTAKVKTNYYEVSLQYPLSYFSSAGLTLGLRQDKTVFLATEKYSLEFPPIKSLWSMLTLSYTLDKLQPTLPLLYRGFNARTAVDVFKGFTQKQDALAGLSMQACWHKPLYKYITLVVQAKAGYSAGDNSILYNLGGVDNSVNPRIDSTVHFAQDAPFAFQTLVTPFRGYYQNSLYGSQYALLNADVYFPLFQSLIPLETPLSSINNLQLGVFADVAAAGGKKAYTTADKGWQAAYGLSARTTLAGYPLRFDIGWPGDFSKQPVWYLSLNTR